MELLRLIEAEDVEGVANLLARSSASIVNFYDEKANEFPLGVAASVGNLELVLLLLSHGARLHQTTLRGCTVLHEAAKGPSVEVFDYLRKHFNLASTNQCGWTVLHFSAAYGSEEMTAHLIQLGLEIDKKDADGLTPLALASKNTYARIVALLIDAGADINTTDKYGQTPLHKAASVGSLLVIKNLVGAGARVDICDSNGFTAFDVADEVGQTDCAIYLWENGTVAQSSVGFAFGSLEWKRPTFRGGPSPRYSHKSCAVGSHICGYGSQSRIEHDLYVFDTTQQKTVTLIDVHHPNTVNLTNMALDKIVSSPLVSISEDGLKAVCSNTRESRKRVSAVIANKPYLKKSCPYGYFEVNIIDSGKRNEIGIGLCSRGYSMEKHPGWEEWSYGYHGDDGRTFHNYGNGTAWGQMYGSGDTIGCGVNFDTREVFWTKNGKLIGIAYKDVPESLEVFPVVGLTAKASIEVVFDGKRKPFKYNFETQLYNWMQLEIPMNFRRFMGLNAEMFPIQDNKILFWIDDIAILDTSTMSWELVQTKGQYQPEDGFAHVVGSTLYSFFASERSFRQLRIGEWEWQDWEVDEQVLPVTVLSTADKVYSSAVGESIYIWCNADPDIYIYNTISQIWTLKVPTGRIPPFNQYSCTTMGTQILTFGGWDNKKQQNDVFCLDTRKMTWYKPHVTGISFPRPRNNHTAVAVENKLYCIAGWDGRGFLSDVDVLECSPLFQKSDALLFQSCFNSTYCSDVDLVVHGQVLPAHKIILVSRSKFFRDRLKADTTSLDLTEAGSFDALYAMIEYLYTESLNLERIGILSSSISHFLSAVKRVLPEFKDIFTEKLILTRVRIPSHVFQDMRYAWKLRDFCDVTIVVSGVHFHLHKAIICSRSSFFRALCGTGLKESQSSCVHLNEDDPRVLEAIFEYLYTDELELTEENHELVIPILIAANQYSVVGCKEFMEDVVGCNLDVENVLSLALLAEQHEAKRLAKYCWDFISHPENFMAVFAHPEYHTLKDQVHALYGSDVVDRISRMYKQDEKPNAEETEEKTGSLFGFFRNLYK